MKGGVGCSIGCRCEGCKNAFGRKDGELYLNIFATFFLMNDNYYIEGKQRMVPTHLNLQGEKPKEEESRWKWAHPVTKSSPAD